MTATDRWHMHGTKVTFNFPGKSGKRHAIDLQNPRLGNTPPVCRKCYIHPVVLDVYLAGEVVKITRSAPAGSSRATSGLSGEEQAVRAFLERKMRDSKRALAEQLECSVRRLRRDRRAGFSRPG